VTDDATPELTPLDVDGVSAIATGTAVWALALVGCLLLRGRLAEAGNSWWTWVCATAVVLGLAGLAYVRRRRAAYAAR
jgi:hypothetical protein